MTKKPGLFASMQDLISRTKGPEGFEGLPDTLERVLGRLDDSDLDPKFRADIYELLLNAANLSELLAEQTYDATSGTKLCSKLHEILARVAYHLTLRPSNRAFGVLFPRTNTLHEDICASEEEAFAKLEGLKRIGLREAGEVVEVTITSSRLAQPKAPRAPKLDAEFLEEVEAKIAKEMK